MSINATYIAADVSTSPQCPPLLMCSSNHLSQPDHSVQQPNLWSLQPQLPQLQSLNQATPVSHLPKEHWSRHALPLLKHTGRTTSLMPRPLSKSSASSQMTGSELKLLHPTLNSYLKPTMIAISPLSEGQATFPCCAPTLHLEAQLPALMVSQSPALTANLQLEISPSPLFKLSQPQRLSQPSAWSSRQGWNKSNSQQVNVPMDRCSNCAQLH